MLIYTNGDWVDAARASVPFFDQGFMYGDSLFETIRINHGRPFRVEKHLERMKSGMDIIRMDGDPLLSKVPGLVQEFIDKNQVRDALLRVMVTRGVSSLGAQVNKPGLALYMTARPITPVPEGPVKIIFLQEQDYPLLRFYPAIKSGNYLGNMLAKKDADAQGAFEPVFVNADGYITECAIRNIFFIKDKVLLTPSVKLGVLPGVIRDTIMDVARQRGMGVEEAFILKEQVNTMDEAFISSTGVGVLPVTWDGFESHYEQSKLLRADLERVFDNGEFHVTQV